MKLPEMIYYTDELTDEFSAGGITPRVIDENYKYAGGPFRWLARGFFYHFLAKLLAPVYLKIAFDHRIVGREKLKKTKGRSFFMYGNHTNPVPDALIPTMINYTGSTYVIVHPDNVSMPVLGKITPSLGAIPLPDGRGAYKNFSAYMEDILKKGKCITIYPEAHIWPYYTHIRNFKADSFHYPVAYNVPVYCFTNTYQKRKNSKRPRIVTYIDGPFFPDEELKRPARVQDLRERVYGAMVKDSANSNVELIKYIKKTENK